MKKWKCSVCNYIHEGKEPPEKCPVCGAGKEKFIEITASEEDDVQKTSTQPDQEKESSATIDQPLPPSTLLEKMSNLILENHLHPISVHTPNGIIPVAFIFLLLAVLVQSSSLESAAYYNMIIVFFSMPVVVLTGYVAWQKKI